MRAVVLTSRISGRTHMRVASAMGPKNHSREPMRCTFIDITAVPAAPSGGVVAAPVREENAR